MKKRIRIYLRKEESELKIKEHYCKNKEEKKKEKVKGKLQ